MGSDRAGSPPPPTPSPLSQAGESFALPLWVVVGFYALVGAMLWWAARGYLAAGAPFGDDNSSHTAWFVAVAQVFKAGGSDFFFGQQNLGVPMFLSYQPLPGLLMGGLYALVGAWVSPWALMKLSLLALWTAMPFVYFAGARGLGLSRLTAFALGLLVLVLQDPYDYGLSFETYVYRGLYSQLFGMFFLPLALGSIYRYLIRERGRFATPLLCYVLLFLSHAFFGLFVGMATVLMLLCQPREGWRGRWLKALALFGCTVALIAFWMVPLLRHVALVGGLPWKTHLQDGWPLSRSVAAFFNGEYFDAGRLPWVGLLVLLGVLGCLKRLSQPLARWLLALFALSFCLFLGRNFWGALYTSLPLHREINAMRYFIGLHFVGLVCGAWALSALSEWALARLEDRGLGEQAQAALGLALALGLGFYSHYALSVWPSKLRTFPLGERDFRGLVRQLSKDRGRRYAVHRSLGTHSHFHRDLLAMLSRRAHLRSFGMTFHATFGTYYGGIFRFEQTRARLLNVGALVALGAGKPPGGYFRLSWKMGRYRIYRAPDAFGYFDTARVGVRICGKDKAMRRLLRTWSPRFFGHGFLPLLEGPSCPAKPLPTLWLTPKGYEASWDGSPASRKPATEQWLAEVLARQKKRSRRGALQIFSQGHAGHRFFCEVAATEAPQLLFLKVNYFPYWQAWIGKNRAPVWKVGPHFMAVQVPVGRHKLRFVYRNPSYQKWLFALSGLLLVLLGAVVGAQAAGLRGEGGERGGLNRGSRGSL